MIQIYHNPRCGKSRNALSLVVESGKEYEVIKYLEQPPTYDDVVLLLKKLNLKPLEIVRQKEKIWIENFKNTQMTDEKIVEALVSYPILIERPILINGDKAIIGRALDKLHAFL